jgi:ankyrin repeat protein
MAINNYIQRLKVFFLVALVVTGCAQNAYAMDNGHSELTRRLLAGAAVGATAGLASAIVTRLKNNYDKKNYLCSHVRIHGMQKIGRIGLLAVCGGALIASISLLSKKVPSALVIYRNWIRSFMPKRLLTNAVNLEAPYCLGLSDIECSIALWSGFSVGSIGCSILDDKLEESRQRVLTDLRESARNGFVERVRELIPLVEPENAQCCCDYDTPLMCAAQNGHIEVVRALLEGFGLQGIDCEKFFFKTALLCAIREGHADIIRELVAAGADINKVSEECYDPLQKTPVSVSLQVRRLDILQLLIELGADVNARDANGNTLLMSAIRCNEFDCIQELLKHVHINCINAVNKEGSTALIIASRQNTINAVQELLAISGIELNQINNADETALLFAVRHGNQDIVKALLDAGAQVDQREVEAAMLLDEAAGNTEMTDIVRSGVIFFVKPAASFNTESF